MNIKFLYQKENDIKLFTVDCVEVKHRDISNSNKNYTANIQQLVYDLVLFGNNKTYEHIVYGLNYDKVKTIAESIHSDDIDNIEINNTNIILKKGEKTVNSFIV